MGKNAHSLLQLAQLFVMSGMLSIFVAILLEFFDAGFTTSYIILFGMLQCLIAHHYYQRYTELSAPEEFDGFE